MTDYDATAHISEEVKRAAYAAPAAIVIGSSLQMAHPLYLCPPSCHRDWPHRLAVQYRAHSLQWASNYRAPRWLGSYQDHDYAHRQTRYICLVDWCVRHGFLRCPVSTGIQVWFTSSS